MSSKKFVKKIYFFIGTTTELIKLSPIIVELEKRKIDFKIITSGQTEVNFSELAFLIKKQSADISLGEKGKKSSLLLFALWSFKTLLKTFTLKQEFLGLNKTNSYFIVHGDPVSALIGALIAKIYKLKLVHIESGLRSFNFFEPFPEEICRFIISRLADIHFCPNNWSVKNLLNVHGQKVNTFENTQIEAYFSTSRQKTNFRNDLGIKNKKYFVLIVHRQEHVIFSKKESKALINHIIKNAPKELTCIFITHLTTKHFLKSVNFRLSTEEKQRVKLVSRLKYIDFVNLINEAEFLATDGGSNQEEAFYRGLPCLVLRKVTERIEGLDGNVVLAKNDEDIITSFLQNYKDYRRKKVQIKISPAKIVADFLVKN